MTAEEEIFLGLGVEDDSSASRGVRVVRRYPLVLAGAWGVRVKSEYMESQVIKKVDPEYPPLARQARVQGTVVLQVRINKTGDVEKIDVMSGHPMLAPAAEEAVKQWKYRPYMMAGQPQNVQTTVTVNFKLAPEPSAKGVVGDIPGGAAPGQQGGIVGAVDTARTSLPAPPLRVRVSSGVMTAFLLKKVAPIYPEEARQKRIEGSVILKEIIDKQGNVASLELISGHPLLAPAAIEAVKQWKYKPYLLNQQPVEIETQAKVNFTLH